MSKWGDMPVSEIMPWSGAMVLQWLNSPVAWTVIVLIMSAVGILRELFF